ncbi:hypothetical protein ACP4OV_030529 [Aristida adscensionis]
MEAGGSSCSPPPLRIVNFPWLAFGHLLPYLELAERLASRGHRVSFVSTPRNIARLPPVRPAAASLLDLVALPLPKVGGACGAESTNDVAPELLWKAFDGLAAPFTEFLATACTDDGGGSERPDWVVVDSFHHWAAAAAVQHKVPCAMLLPTAAAITALSSSERGCILHEPPVAEERPVGVPRHEWELVARALTDRDASGASVFQRMSLTLERCTLAAMRSCPEWELQCFPLAAALLRKPLVPLGLLPPLSSSRRRGRGDDDDDATLRWLDAQPPESVVYMAMGSEVPLRVKQVHELALGLELAGTRFLWALRKPHGVPDGDVLPAEFQERTRGRGLVATGWVPQITILAHAATGAFFIHCGRNSLIEGLLFRNPLVMLPIMLDQGPNARLMEGRRVGLQVPRDDEDGSFTRHGVASAVRAVMLDGEARSVFVANARKLQQLVADEERQEGYVDEFIRQLRSRSK